MNRAASHTLSLVGLWRAEGNPPFFWRDEVKGKGGKGQLDDGFQGERENIGPKRNGSRPPV